jgi:hypothetical protein
MNCPNCGTPNEPEAAFCGRCGTPLLQPALATPELAPVAEQKRSRTPTLLIAIVAVAAGLLLACCLCGVLGGGLTLIGPLAGQTATSLTQVPIPPTRAVVVTQFPIPTVPPPPTVPLAPTRVVVVTPAPSSTPPAVNTPASSPVASSETTKTYENASLGFSIEYPDNWTVESEQETNVTFLHPGGQLRVAVAVVKNASWASGVAANAALIEDFAKNGSVENTSSSTLDFAGATWAISEFKHVQGSLTNSAALISTVRGGTLYSIVDYGPPDVYNRETNPMAKMALSFKFLGPAPVTPTPTKPAAGIYRATVAINSSSGIRIRGRVLNSSGRPVAGALIELYNAEKHYLLGTGTGTDGRYELTISAGTYYMKIKNHNSAWSPLITVKWGQEATVDWQEQ